MTHTTAAVRTAPTSSPTPVQSPVPSGPAARSGALRGVVARQLQGTPGRLRVGALACVLACLGFAVLGASAFQARGNALSDARADAAQLVRVQSIASNLVLADSKFTNGYLAYGLEPPGQLDQYNQAVADASRLLAEAAQANPADAAQLARVNDALTRYTARVAASRVNNLHGFQVSTGYLRQASALLRSPDSRPNLLPTLDAVVQANSARVDQAFAASRNATWRLVGAGACGLLVLLGAQVWLSRRTHRMLNLPLVGASLAVVVALAIGGVVMAGAAADAQRVRGESYAATLALARARVAAYVAKSYESITVIYVGTGGDHPGSEKSYQTSLAEARSQLATAADTTGQDVGTAELDAWDAAHRQVYDLARSDWVAAAKKATALGTDSVNARFTAADQAIAPALRAQAAKVSTGLAARHTSLLVTGWLTLVLGLVAAGAAWWGFSQRLGEYR